MRLLRVSLLVAACFTMIATWAQIAGLASEDMRAIERRVVVEQKVESLEEKLKGLEKLNIESRLALLEDTQKTTKTLLTSLLVGIITLVGEAGIRLIRSKKDE